MFVREENFQIVILKRPYDTYQSSRETRDLLSNIFKLKLDGYKKYYPYGILPISEIDFIGDHVIICKREGESFRPISAWKFIRFSDCVEFNIPFPIFNHKFGQQIDQFGPYVDGIKKWMKELQNDQTDFGYTASWTMDTDLTKAERNFIRDLTYSLICLYPTSEGINNIINSAAALHGVNTHKETMGMEYLKDNEGEILKKFESPTFYQQPFYIMHTPRSGFSNTYKESCLRFQTLWENRVITGEKKIARKNVA